MHRRLQIVHARVGNSDWWTWAVGMAKEGKGKLCLPKCRSLYQSIDDPISQKTSQRSSPEYHIITISRQGLGHLLKPQSWGERSPFQHCGVAQETSGLSLATCHRQLANPKSSLASYPLISFTPKQQEP
ncbi:unnamed protein product [Prunus armeniaca]|uniref:Uncharacterized protein n=1 Tax=Prunus armeniaca TaxID=36596 RepID=A0A6J5WDR6_PRUAR|nr:unnamed protein product [Prunus armeniaca]